MSMLHYVKKALSVERLPFVLLSVFLFLLPLFFYPLGQLSLEFSKSLFITLVVIASFAVYVVSLLKKGRLELPKNLIFITLALLLLAYLGSSVLGVSPMFSLFGYGYEVTTFASLLLATMLMFVVALSFRNVKRLSIAYAAFFLSALILGLFHALRLFFGPDTLDFGIFRDVLANTIGKWNEIGIFFGVSTILSLFALHILPLRTTIKVWGYVLLVLSIIMLISINMPLLWYAMAAFSLIFFLYVIFFDSSVSLKLEASDMDGGEGIGQSSHRKISISALVLLVISIIFILPIGNAITSKVATWMTPQNIEVRPSWGGTLDVAKDVLKQDALLGTGPNTFSYAWQLHKPDVNATNFWNVDFASGIGYVPTTLATGGIVSFALWILFMLAVLYVGVKGLFAKIADPFLRYIVQSSFFVVAFLLLFLIIYSPSAVIFYTTFFFLGLFIAALYSANILKTIDVSFFRLPRLSFVFVIVLVFVLIASLGLGYIVSEKAISSAYFQQGVIALNAEGNIQKGEELLFKAIEMAPNDLYYRTFADMSILQINNIIASVTNVDTISEETKAEFQRALAAALEASRLAQTTNPSGFENWMSVFRVYETVTPLGVDKAYESAVSAYDEAVKLSPRHPALLLARARLEVAKNDLPKAKEFINQALQMKENYADAIFYLSQIEVAEGNIQAAIKSVERIAFISPTSPAIYFRLGLLEYESKDYASAAAAFERAISLVPVYANAKYFLGLSYAMLDRNADAVKVFEELSVSNPESVEVKSILENLKAGRAPFATGAETPEDREELPLEENI